MFGSKDTSCPDNLLTEGWDPNNVLDVSCPGSTCGNHYTLDPEQPNLINWVGGTVCPASSHPSSVTFTQPVTSPTAGTQYRFTVDIVNFSGFLGSSGCSAFGNTTFLVSLDGVGATSYSPTATYISSPLTGCVAGNGTLEVILDVPFAANETKNLTFGMTPIGFGVGACGSYASTFSVANARLEKLQ